MLGERIKKLRINKNLNQEQLAEKLFMKKNYISRYENERVTPPIETIIKLAEIFNVSTDYLLGVSEIRSRETITTEEQQLLNEYRELKGNERYQIIGFIQGLKTMRV
ncbi:MAG: hypothetical protein A2Y24_06520 [Clostridiales bacterium GWE2_32_10]|nr:MAG: hypothetical protein A2Y24_06520 [Clostridiales bacterium GWE2_32_10]